MRTFRRQMMSESLEKKNNPVLKQWGMAADQDNQVQMPLHNLHGGKITTPVVNGVNGVVETYIVTSSGTADGSLWSINLSNLPGQQKRLISVSQASTFLLNYASNQYPGRINILCNQVTPTKDKFGDLSHVVGSLVPCGAPTSIINSGGVIGFNIGYSLLGAINATEITGIPSLTFDATVDDSSVPATYPLAEPITFIVQITRVVF